MAATRRRILDAAFAEFAERGIEHTSMQAVARRADVAPGTVLYHFAGIGDLAAAVVDRLLERLDLPRPAALPATGPLADRAGRLVELLYRFYERSGDLYPFLVQNRRHPAVQSGLAGFEGARRALLERALQGWDGPPSAAVVVAALVDPSFHANLVQGGLSTDQAVEYAATLAGRLLDRAGGAEAGEHVGS